MSDLAIRVSNVSKKYRIGVKEDSADTLGGKLIKILKSPLQNYRKLKSLSQFSETEASEDSILALNDISFDVAVGEVLGVIGNNGAGKSTLLKILSRITEPTRGEIILQGRLSSLLEVGTGFHPELTGRENVYLNGTILGMKKREVETKFDEIVSFSGVEKFIDTPVKRYSSGMKVRLAFAVAAHLEPEILLIDEVLAVGDVEFQKKCLGKMESISQEGRTVLFVSHNLDAVSQLCSRCILLKDGDLAFNGDVSTCIDLYLQNEQSSLSKLGIPEDKRLEAQVLEFAMYTENKIQGNQIKFVEDFYVRINYLFRKSLDEAYVIIRVKDLNGKTIITTTDKDFNKSTEPRKEGWYESVIRFPGKFFMPGTYTITCAIIIPKRAIIHKISSLLYFNILPTKLEGYKEDWLWAKDGYIFKEFEWDIKYSNVIDA